MQKEQRSSRSERITVWAKNMDSTGIKSVVVLVVAMYIIYFDSNSFVNAFLNGGAGIHSSSDRLSRNNRGIHVNMMAGPQPFNPFTARNRNTNVKWFETDLDRFYNFVESQPLLTAEQEIAYGKALKLWISIEKKER